MTDDLSLACPRCSHEAGLQFEPNFSDCLLCQNCATILICDESPFVVHAKFGKRKCLRILQDRDVRSLSSEQYMQLAQAKEKLMRKKMGNEDFDKLKLGIGSALGLE